MKDHKFRLKTSIKTIALASLSLLFNQLAYAAPITAPQAADIRAALPGSVEPGVISNTLSAAPIEAPPPRAAAIAHPEEKPGNLGPQAEKIKFKLNAVILEGNRTYSTPELSRIYADKLHKTISIADLETIVQNITNYYRNNGYILSRAVLPPQHVANGTVRIRIIEGYIAEAKVQGTPKRARYLLQNYGNNIAASRPTQIRVMEHYLRLANEIPGMNARAVLEPSKTDTGASDIDLVATEQSVNAYLSYDNYGTRYIGPNQVTGSVSGNSIFQSGDSTHFTAVRTSRPEQLQYEDVSHEIPIGSSGLRATVGVNDSRTLPGLNLAILKISGDATNFYGILSYPLLRSRDQDLSLDGGVNYIDSGVNTFDDTLYNDHIRSAKFGASYNSSDSFLGSNLLSLHVEQGFASILGASSDPTSPTVSRFGADGHFTKFDATAGRLQALFWHLSTFIYASGQYSFNPLLATEQFAYGGSQLGRGYDPAEIIGDRGAAGSVELRLDWAPGWRFLQSMQPYLFYDAGVVWNLKDVAGSNIKSSATSTGFGARFNFTKNLTGNLMFAQPLTKQVTAEEVVGQGRLPRGFFSITASV